VLDRRVRDRVLEESPQSIECRQSGAYVPGSASFSAYCGNTGSGSVSHLTMQKRIREVLSIPSRFSEPASRNKSDYRRVAAGAR
jgi:hypothetical protein